MATVFDDGFVEAFAKSTGEKHIIPAHYLDDPVLGRDFELTPSAKARAAADSPDGDPDDSWTHAQLDQYAGDNSIDLTGAKTVKDKVAAIADARDAAPAGGGPGNDPTGGGQPGQAASTPGTPGNPA